MAAIHHGCSPHEFQALDEEEWPPRDGVGSTDGGQQRRSILPGEQTREPRRHEAWFLFQLLWDPPAAMMQAARAAQRRKALAKGLRYSNSRNIALCSIADDNGLILRSKSPQVPADCVSIDCSIIVNTLTEAKIGN
jgi:hypothetical protein